MKTAGNGEDLCGDFSGTPTTAKEGAEREVSVVMNLGGVVYFVFFTLSAAFKV